MFIFIAIFLTLIALAMRIMASGIDLANKAAMISTHGVTRNHKIANSVRKVTSIGLVTSSSLLRTGSFIISRVRDILLIFASLILILDVVIFLLVSVSAAGYYTLYTANQQEETVDETINDLN